MKNHKWTVVLMLLTAALVVAVWSGCSTARPLVVEVSGKKRDHEEYFVRWQPSSIRMVKFEYRQLHAPNKIFEQRCTYATRPCATFLIRGAAFESGGPVSAWRVSLWTDANTCVAERKSALW
jgi:hypothetical protein